ncbi:predicted protein [Enterococcus gallinarum EG2]|nr:predicted protein [Enterococcus gallinarum EG2]
MNQNFLGQLCKQLPFCVFLLTYHLMCRVNKICLKTSRFFREILGGIELCQYH